MAVHPRKARPRYRLCTGDLDTFVNVLLRVDVDPIHALKADINNDGTPNGRDISPFADSLLSL